MQPQNIGDFAQDEGTHGHFAVLEELALAVDDGLGDAVDGVETLLHVFQQPAGLLELAAEVAVAPALLGENLGVEPVDAEARVASGLM